MRKLRWLAVCLYMTLLIVPMITYTLFYDPPAAKKRDIPKDERSAAFKTEIKLYLKKEDKVVTLDAYDYICGVVCAEMSPDFEKEALRAQAVAAFTYAVNKMEYTINNPDADNGHSGGYVCDDYNHCKAYIPTDEAVKKLGSKKYEKIADAVYDSLGFVITYGGAPINAVFHSICCGKTADAAEVWGNDVPYLKSVPCEGDKQADGYQTKVTVKKSEFSDILESELGVTLPSDADNWIGDITLYPSGYVNTVSIGGTEYAGTLVRRLFSFRCAAFDVCLKDENVVFTVRGYGHGVGLSQSGANEMAKDGKSFEQILTYFYKDVTIEQYKK